MQLREYQTRALEMLYEWFEKNHSGHPVLNMPGGSGKSVVIASIVKDALQNWPETRVMMLVHSRELIQQNANKMRALWPEAPLGIYSASLGKREIGEQILFAGIQSVHNRASEIGHVDLLLIDEVHAVSASESGTYRKLIKNLMEINPDIRMVGFSASPYRLGHGLITEGKEAIFTDIIDPVSIEELVHKKYLTPLRSKLTKHSLSTEGLHKRQGDFIASEMEQKFNTEDHNVAIVDEIIRLASDRKHWLIFCSGVKHSDAVAQAFRDRGITAESLTGGTPKSERIRMLEDFASCKIQAMCSVGILTTGYDLPSLDCIAFLRATMSPGLYLQMAVRGMRIAEGKKNCLVLDFAGVVRTHGPITAVQPPKRSGEGNGEAPVKVCEECDELVHISAKECPNCGHEFPKPPPKVMKLANDDIMGIAGTEMEVTSWQWRVHVSRASGKELLKVSYYGSLSDPKVDEYLAVMHEGYAGQKAMGLLVQMKDRSGAPNNDSGTISGICEAMNEGKPPRMIEYKKDGKFFRVMERVW